MSRKRLWAGALAAVVVLAGTAWVVLDHGPTYDHALKRFGDHGMKNRFVDLDDGSQISIGSPDRHRIVVQWKDPDGHGWTSPKTVHENKKDTAVDTTVRYGGSTVAIDAWFSHDTSSESDTDGVDVKIACISARHSCDVREDRGSPSSAPEVTGDGRTILFVAGSDRAVFWSTDGFRREKVEVPTQLKDAQGAYGDTVLAADGSLRKLVGQRDGNRCILTLLGSRPRAAEFKKLTVVSRPYKSRFGGGCTDGISTRSTVWVKLNGWTNSWPPFWLVRRGNQWHETTKDPSGLILTPYAPGCRFMVQTQFVNPDNLSFGSTDGRNIRVQVLRHGAERWTKPVVLDGVPAGATMKCVSFDAQIVGRDGFAVVLSGGRPAYGRAVTVTRDQVHWETTYLPGARGRLSVDNKDRVHLGQTVVWTPADGFITS